MDATRYLCSELVEIEANGVRATVNLEEIWAGGAVMEAESPLEAGTHCRMRAGNRSYWCTVALVDLHTFGCRVQLEFSPMTQWKVEEYSPQHLLDPSTLGAGGV